MSPSAGPSVGMVTCDGYRPTDSTPASPWRPIPSGQVRRRSQRGAVLQLIVTKDYEDLSRRAAQFAALLILAAPASTVVPATGNTPVGMYLELARELRDVGGDTSQLRIFQLDEYVDISSDDRRSLYLWMQRAFLVPLVVPESNVTRLPSSGPNMAEACQAYEQSVRSLGGFDLAVLGLGPNGHLGFNEPPSDEASPTRVVSLSEESVASNARYWGRRDQVPRRAVTAGMDLLLAARCILLLVSGERKRDILRRTMEGPVAPAVPSSYLQRTPNVTIFADEAALGS